MKHMKLLILAGLSMLAFLVVAPAQAGMIGTGDALIADQAASDRAHLVAMLDRDDVAAQLERHGVSPEDAKARVAAMSDAEVRMMAERLDALPAGAASGWAIAAGVFIAFIITDLLGWTNIFPFIH